MGSIEERCPFIDNIMEFTKEVDIELLKESLSDYSFSIVKQHYMLSGEIYWAKDYLELSH